MISTDKELSELLPSLAQAAWLALDTEADSLHSYPEKLCLIQISIPGMDVLIDPLAKMDLSPLFSVLLTKQLILHGADYDLRLFNRGHRFVPQAIFDTMLAARLLGIRQFGLSDLARHYLEVHLEKGPQKANWARRPLTDRMRHYAMNDTRFLRTISNYQKTELEAKGRLEWHAEACARLIADCARESERDEDSVWRIKGSDRLSPPALAVLRELWQWRDQEAILAAKPPFFIMEHATLVALAEGAVRDPKHLHWPPRLSPRRLSGLKSALQRGLDCPASMHPAFLRSVGRRSTAQERLRFERLRKVRDLRAHELGLDPTVIASKATLIVLSQDWEEHSARLMSWQKEILQPAVKRA